MHEFSEGVVHSQGSNHPRVGLRYLKFLEPKTSEHSFLFCKSIIIGFFFFLSDISKQTGSCLEVILLIVAYNFEFFVNVFFVLNNLCFKYVTTFSSPGLMKLPESSK